MMNGIDTQASSTSIEMRRDPGRGKEGGIVPAERAHEVRDRAEAVFQHRLADHPADRDRAQHERDQEDHAEELSRPDFLIEQQRQPEGDRIFDGDRQHVEDHVAERVPVERVVDELDEIIEAVEFSAGERAQVPVGEGDVESEERRKDRHREDEEHRRQNEQRALARLAAAQDQARRQAQSTRAHRRRGPAARSRSRRWSRRRRRAPGRSRPR